MRFVLGRVPASLVLALCLGLALMLVVAAWARELGQWATALGSRVTSGARLPASGSSATTAPAGEQGATAPLTITTTARVTATRTDGVTAPAQPVAVGLPLVVKSYPERVVLGLPMVVKRYIGANARVGFCGGIGAPEDYPALEQLGAGWYYSYGTETSPRRPNGIEFVQTVRLHQLTQCWPLRLRERSSGGEDCPQGQPCPYVTPYTYTVSPGRPALVAVVQANPGALWFIGNEPDRRDWDAGVLGGRTTCVLPLPRDRGSGQDEMLPEVYATAYHELYYLLKAADPTARVTIGGIVQATPARLDYLSKIWDSYRAQYGEDMPVDVWNVHNFIFTEDCGDYGADVPPGYTGVALLQGTQPWYDTVYNDPCKGTPYLEINGVFVGFESHDNIGIFQAQIRAFREWMLAHGQKDKPLYVSEFGIVYPMIFEPEDADHPDAHARNQARATNFMLATFDYMFTARDPRLGYAADDNRLVQRWAWFSLGPYDTEYTYLYNSQTKQLTAIGQAFALWARTH